METWWHDLNVVLDSSLLFIRIIHNGSTFPACLSIFLLLHTDWLMVKSCLSMKWKHPFLRGWVLIWTGTGLLILALLCLLAKTRATFLLIVLRETGYLFLYLYKFFITPVFDPVLDVLIPTSYLVPTPAVWIGCALFLVCHVFTWESFGEMYFQYSLCGPFNKALCFNLKKSNGLSPAVLLN